jgi:hypothetical protein
MAESYDGGVIEGDKAVQQGELVFVKPTRPHLYRAGWLNVCLETGEHTFLVPALYVALHPPVVPRPQRPAGPAAPGDLGALDTGESSQQERDLLYGDGA